MKPKFSNKEQQVAADILLAFNFARDMEEFMQIWMDMFQFYDLCLDPFTRLPCTSKEYAKSSLEYDKQCMYERYGHIDGLD